MSVCMYISHRCWNTPNELHREISRMCWPLSLFPPQVHDVLFSVSSQVEIALGSRDRDTCSLQDAVQ